MTDTPIVELTVEDSVATLALNRPDKFNAVNGQMHRELAAAMKTISRSSEIRALIFTGRGKAFCAGQDLSEFDSKPAGYRVDELVRTTFNRFVLGLRELPIPVIAAVNGVAAGAGASLALAADIRICSDRAMFMQAFVRVGLVPDTGSTWLLPHLIGIERALHLAFTGEGVDAARAVELGMATMVVEHDSLMEKTQAYAADLASRPTRSLGLTKRAMYRSLTSSFPDALEYEAQLQQYAAQTIDHREGVTAFLEKRDPVFVGR